MASGAPRPVIVGGPADPHVQAVARGLVDPVLVDVEALRTGRFALTSDGLLEATSDGWTPVASGTRGWIRRFAPTGWTEGTEAHSRRAAEQAAWLSMLVSYVRVGGVSWLTGLDEMLAAENKMRLVQVAASVVAPCPPTVVATSPMVAKDILGTDLLVAKPIGPASFLSGGDYVSIPTSDVSELAGTPFAPEPYLYQQRVVASRHLRVVTVGRQCWCFARYVHIGEPLDWRYLNTTHDEFNPTPLPNVERLAVALAHELNIGYSSQDWLDDGETIWVVDVNPVGQWLFLGEGSADLLTLSMLGMAVNLGSKNRFMIIDTVLLSKVNPPIIRNLVAAYPQVVKAGFSVLATRYLIYRKATFLQLLGALVLLVVWVLGETLGTDMKE